MGFFDNVKNSLTETSQELTQKAKDTTEIYRLNNLNKTKEKEIEKLVYQIGLTYYSNFREECEEKFSDLTTQIAQIQKEIAENKQMIEKLSTEEVCPSCGKKLTGGSKFCIYCGTSLDAVKNEAKVSGKTCSSCGKPLDEGAAFCTYCGTPVPEEKAEEKGDQEVQEQVIEVEDKNICKNCGAKIEEGNRFCTYCGTPVEE